MHVHMTQRALQSQKPKTEHSYRSEEGGHAL